MDNSPDAIKRKVAEMIQQNPILRSKVGLIVNADIGLPVADHKGFYTLWADDGVEVLDLLSRALPLNGIRPQV